MYVNSISFQVYKKDWVSKGILYPLCKSGCPHGGLASCDSPTSISIFTCLSKEVEKCCFFGKKDSSHSAGTLFRDHTTGMRPEGSWEEKPRFQRANGRNRSQICC